jgi:hypothetical protein
MRRHLAVLLGNLAIVGLLPAVWGCPQGGGSGGSSTSTPAVNAALTFGANACPEKDVFLQDQTAGVRYTSGAMLIAVSVKVRCKGNSDNPADSSGIAGVMIQLSVPGASIIGSRTIGPTDAEGLASGSLQVPGSSDADEAGYRGKTVTFEAQATNSSWRQVGAVTVQ